MSNAGEQFTLVCKALLGSDQLEAPYITWFAPDGSTVTSNDQILLDGPTMGSEYFGGETITTYSLSLTFTPLRTSHQGTYNCTTSVSGSTASETVDVDVTGTAQTNKNHCLENLFLQMIGVRFCSNLAIIF